MRRTLAVAWTIARRDYVAAVWSRLFLLFLALPLVLGLVGAGFGAIGVRQDAPSPRAAIAVVPSLYPQIAAARARLVAGLGEGAVPPVARAGDAAAAVTIEGSPARPRLRAAADAPPGAIAAAALLVEQRQASAAPPPPPVARAGMIAPDPARTPRADGLAQGVQYLILTLTILLSGRLLSSFVEERSSKVIEVLAAAAPIDAIFLGKLGGMLLYAFTAVLAWAAMAAATALAVAPGLLATLPAPALGWPVFCALSLLYFAASFLLFGALLLGLGAHAATPADIQTLALPTTIAQFLAFVLASLGVADPGGRIATIAAVVPWSSPLAMAARAAELPAAWPHAAALAWQFGWVALTVRIAAGLFRRSILRSGPRRGH